MNKQEKQKRIAVLKSQIDDLLFKVEASKLKINLPNDVMSEYLRQTKILQNLRIKYKKSILDNNTELANKLHKSIIKLDANIKKVDSMLGGFTTPGGNYREALKLKTTMEDTLKWFTSNYKQNKNECITILTQAQKDYPFTIDDFKKGCVELRKIPLEDQDHLPTHIKLIGELSNVGINANIAGEKIREALLKINE